MEYNAIILNDYAHAQYASWVKCGKKTIETRERMFSYRGDIVICCGKTNSVSENAGKALCMVELYKVREMHMEDVQAACVEYSRKRYSLLLRNWRHFSEDFDFSDLKTSGTWQGIFKITIPSHITIVDRPDIIPFNEKQLPNLFSIFNHNQ